MGRLSRGVLALSAIGLALSAAAPVLAQGTPSAAEEILRLVNERRAEAGLRPLRLQAQLQRAAQSYAEQMAQTGVFSHTGRDGSTPFSRMTAAGYRGTMMGENIARGFTSPRSVMDAWMNSSGHRANILNPGYTDLGIGIAGANSGTCWVQDFGASEYEESPEAAQPLPPAITGISPYYGRVGDPVTISGQRFGTTPGSVTFSGGQKGETSSWADTRIVVSVPHGAVTGPLYVQNQAGTSAGAQFYVLEPAADAPSLERISPANGSPGTLVTIYGQRLGATRGSVTFGGIPGVVMNWSPTGYFVQALVPPGAASGPVVVTRGDGKRTNGLSFMISAPAPAPTPIAQPSTPAQNATPIGTPLSPNVTQPSAAQPAPTFTMPTRSTWPYSRYRYRIYRYRQ